MPNLTLLGWIFIAWCAVTSLLVLLLIYRSVISMKEDDQLFLDPAEAHFEAQQRQVLAKLNQLKFYAKRLGFASGGLFAATVGIAIYKAMR